MQFCSRYTLILLVSFFISACSSFGMKPAPTTHWQSQQARLLNINNWTLRGRLIAANSQEQQASSIFWKQTGDAYRIQLSGPIGFGRIILKGNDDGVSISSSKGDKTFANSQQALAYYRLPSIPIEQLRYWALGIPAPTSQAANLKFNSTGQPISFTQNHWQIKLSAHTLEGELALPQVILASQRVGSQTYSITLKTSSRELITP